MGMLIRKDNSRFSFFDRMPGVTIYGEAMDNDKDSLLSACKALQKYLTT